MTARVNSRGNRTHGGRPSLRLTHPLIAGEWCDDLNEKTADELTAGSKVIGQWRGRKCGHIWTMQVSARTKQGQNCHYCSGKRVLADFNDLATTHKAFTEEWCPTNILTPRDVTAGSGERVWWVGKTCGHRWDATVHQRSGQGTGCPFCDGKRVLPGFNDLAFRTPTLVPEWHPTKNGALTPQDVPPYSNQVVWWRYRCGHERQQRIADRSKGSGCRVCRGPGVEAGYNDLATTHPHLADEWHPTKNGDLLSTMVRAGSQQKVWWRGACGHEWDMRPNSRSGAQASGCPFCAGKRVLRGFNDLWTACRPVAIEWHPTLNGTLTPYDVPRASGRKVWWRGKDCGHEWPAAVSDRTRKDRPTGCAVCDGKRLVVGTNDLATTHPYLVDEWHPTLNGDLTPQQVSKGYDKKVWWIGLCGHEWEATVGTRSQGVGCARCWTSKQEAAMVEALTTRFPDLAHGAKIATERWGTRHRHAVIDALLPTQQTVVEYDGSYFHHTPEKVQQDTAKSLALLTQGYRVIRVRDTSKPTDYPLPSLPITDKRYVELAFNPDIETWESLADRVEAVVRG